MPHPSANQTNPLDYPKYVRGIRPALPESSGDYVESELEKIQNSMENMAVAADANTKTQVATLKIDVDNNAAAITNEQTVRAAADEALATQIDTVQSAYQSADAGLQTQINGKNTIYRQSTAPTGGTYVDNDLWIDIDDNNKIHTWNESTSTWDLAADQRIDANTAAITNEQNARATADTALATQISDVSASVVSNTAAIGDNAAAIDAANAAIGTNTGNIASNTAAIIAEQTARADGDSALASDITALTATVDSKNTIYRQSTAPTGGTYVPGDLWFDIDDNNKVYSWSGTAWDAISDLRIDANAAAITTEQTARANGDSANATAISDLSTTVDGHTASITTIQSSVDGLEAKYGVTLNVNGYVTGFQQLNDGTSGSFIVEADKFAIVAPGAAPGDLGTAPFAVIGGAVYIDGQKISDGSVDAGALSIPNLSAITATIGTLRTATSGARVEIHDNQILVYDSSNVLRVQLGVF